MFRAIWVFTKQTWLGFNRDNCSLQAAAISYYALFSAIPAIILAVAVLGFLIADDSRRGDLVNTILDNVPLSETDGRDAVEEALDTVARVRGPIAALSFLGVVWTSSAMFGSIRRSLNIAFRTHEHRPFFRAKLIDFTQLAVLGLIILASIALTGLLRTAREVSVDYFGWLADRNVLWEGPAILLPALLSFTAFALLYRFVPAVKPDWRDALPGALLATVLFEMLKNAFAIYVANFNNFDVIYGSLAGVLLFLLNTYLASNILLIGAELSHVFQRYHLGQLEGDLHPVGPRPSVAEEFVRAFKGLFVRQP